MQEQLAKSSESRMEKFNFTIVHESFEGCAKIVFKCNSCSTRSERIENFRILQLSFSSDLEDLSITKLIYYYLQSFVEATSTAVMHIVHLQMVKR